MSATEVVCYRNGTVHQTKYRYVKCQLQRLYAIGMEVHQTKYRYVKCQQQRLYAIGMEVHQTKYRYVKCQQQRLYAIGMEQSIKQNIGMSNVNSRGCTL